MNIFGNLIKDTEIIGCGEINVSEITPGSPSTKETTYSFRVFTRCSTISIYSPAFKIEQTKDADAWLKKYLTVRELIAIQIGETQPNT